MSTAGKVLSVLVVLVAMHIVMVRIKGVVLPIDAPIPADDEVSP